MASAKISRRELQEDEIRAGLTNIGDVLIARRNEFIIGGLVILGLALGVMIYSSYSGRRNADAQDRLGRVIAAYNEVGLSAADRGKKVVLEGEGALEAAGSAPVSNIIRYYVALGYESSTETSKAMVELDKVIAQGDAQTKGMAQFAKAGILSSHGETDKATAILKELETNGGYPKIAAAVELGRIYENAGNKDEAKTYYDKVVIGYGDSNDGMQLREEGRTALRRMGMPIPTPTPTPPPAAPIPAPAKK